MGYTCYSPSTTTISCQVPVSSAWISAVVGKVHTYKSRTVAESNKALQRQTIRDNLVPLQGSSYQKQPDKHAILASDMRTSLSRARRCQSLQKGAGDGPIWQMDNVQIRRSLLHGW